MKIEIDTHELEPVVEIAVEKLFTEAGIEGVDPETQARYERYCIEIEEELVEAFEAIITDKRKALAKEESA